MQARGESAASSSGRLSAVTALAAALTDVGCTACARADPGIPSRSRARARPSTSRARRSVSARTRRIRENSTPRPFPKEPASRTMGDAVAETALPDLRRRDDARDDERRGGRANAADLGAVDFGDVAQTIAQNPHSTIEPAQRASSRHAGPSRARGARRAARRARHHVRPRHGAHHRRGRHGHRAPRDAALARPQGRGQDAAPRRQERGRDAAPPPRGLGDGHARAPQHRPRLRPRPRRGRLADHRPQAHRGPRVGRGHAGRRPRARALRHRGPAREQPPHPHPGRATR